jgi:hypothetical protein
MIPLFYIHQASKIHTFVGMRVSLRPPALDSTNQSMICMDVEEHFGPSLPPRGGGNTWKNKPNQFLENSTFFPLPWDLPARSRFGEGRGEGGGEGGHTSAPPPQSSPVKGEENDGSFSWFEGALQACDIMDYLVIVIYEWLNS